MSQNQLAEQQCEACDADAPKLSEEEIRKLQPDVPQWQVQEIEGEKRLRRVFKFTDFADALAFTLSVGDIAEAADHHPALLTEWGKVTVDWWTHKIGGLHRNDFTMAARTDQMYGTGCA